MQIQLRFNCGCSTRYICESLLRIRSLYSICIIWFILASVIVNFGGKAALSELMAQPTPSQSLPELLNTDQELCQLAVM